MYNKTMKTLQVGDTVIVKEPSQDEFHNHSFSGHIIEIRPDSILVKDQDDDVYEVDPSTLERL